MNKALIEAIKASSLSVDEIAGFAGMSNISIYRFTQGIVGISTDNAYRLSEILDIPVNTVLGKEKIKYKAEILSTKAKDWVSL